MSWSLLWTHPFCGWISTCQTQESKFCFNEKHQLWGTKLGGAAIIFRWHKTESDLQDSIFWYRYSIAWWRCSEVLSYLWQVWPRGEPQYVKLTCMSLRKSPQELYKSFMQSQRTYEVLSTLIATFSYTCFIPIHHTHHSFNHKGHKKSTTSSSWNDYNLDFLYKFGLPSRRRFPPISMEVKRILFKTEKLSLMLIPRDQIAG